MSQVTELKSHPLVSHNLAILRQKDTDHQTFRMAAHRLSTMVIISATESLKTLEQPVETPLRKTYENFTTNMAYLCMKPEAKISDSV